MGRSFGSRDRGKVLYPPAMDPRDASDIAAALERQATVLDFKLKQDNDIRASFLGIYLVENPLRRTIYGNEVELHIHWHSDSPGVVNAANLRWPREARGVPVRLGNAAVHACEMVLGRMRESNI